MVYLAMTAAELKKCNQRPAHLGYMACHFSPYATGLSNLPHDLPPESLLILNDRTPIMGHDPDVVVNTLEQVICQQKCAALLLDFQRPSEEAGRIIDACLQLPCPVSVSHIFAAEFSCGVFLPPVPILMTPEEHLSNWKDREIWLELAPEYRCVKITEAGTTMEAQICAPDAPWHKEEELHCHYSISIHQTSAEFSIKRREEDLLALRQEAERLGVSHFLGLWQELGQYDTFMKTQKPPV